MFQDAAGPTASCSLWRNVRGLNAEKLHRAREYAAQETFKQNSLYCNS
jgi:hypothetical protein